MRGPANTAPARAAFAYAGAVRDALRRAKFGRELSALRALLPLAVQRLPAPAAADAICFVPLHGRRLLRRGFDPAAVFAHALARAWSLPVLRRGLVCTRCDPPLSFGADAARRARAVAGRYVARDVAGARLVLVDDIVTTGATLREASRALERAGADEPVLVALAATP